MRRAVLCLVLVVLAVVLQYTLVDRLAPPGGGEPDIALLVVVGLALWLGPGTGSLVGFAAGLAMDLAPPASHPVGELAFVFCLVGYGCGRLAGWRGRSFLRIVLVAGAGAVTGEVLQTAFGLAARDPEATPSAVSRVLPAAVLSDLLLVVIAAAGVAVLSRRKRRVPGPARQPVPARQPGPARRPVPVRVPAPRRPDLHQPARPARPVRLHARQMRAKDVRSAGVMR